MALRGTLADFGIADILQLIGQQGKTGLLSVADGAGTSIRVYFQQGYVVRADSLTRDERNLLGQMLARAERITEAQLQAALELQKQTHQRLGEILLETGALEQAELQHFAQLQTAETIYGLFLWQAGTYEFVQQPVQADPDIAPIRSESLLMEGVRQLDEWPAIRSRLGGYATCFQVLADPRTSDRASSELAPADAFDDMFASMTSAVDAESAAADLDLVSPGSLGEDEYDVFGLVQPGRSVQQLIDRSGLGEFATCRALVSLLDAGAIAIAAQPDAPAPKVVPTVGGLTASQPQPVAGVRAVHVALVAVVVLVAVAVGSLADRGLARGSGGFGYRDQARKNHISRLSALKLRDALEVYRAETGAYPRRLDALVEAGYVSKRDLRFPWRQQYFYDVSQRGARVLRPLN